MAQLLLAKPDYRNDGKYQFVVGYTGGGAEECIHLSKEEIEKRMTKKFGKGILVDDGENLFWETDND